MASGSTQARRFLFGDDFRDPRPRAAAAPADPFREEREAADLAGYARGLEAGRCEAEMRTQHRTAEALERIAEAAAAAVGGLDARAREIEGLGVAFFRALAAKLAGRALASQPLAAIAEAAEAAFRHVRGVPHLAVRVAADLVEPVDALLKPMARERGFEGRIIVIGDDQIVPGDARLEWADGGVVRDAAAIDAEISALLAAHRALH